MLSTLMYFSPAFYGQVWYTDVGGDVFHPVTPEMHVVYSVVLLVLLVATILNDFAFSGTVNRRTEPLSALKLNYVCSVSLAMWGAFFVVYFAEIFSGNKEAFGSLYSLAATGVPFALILAANNKSTVWILVFAVVSAIDLYAGNREMIAYPAIAISAIYLLSLGRVRLVWYAKYSIPILIAVVILSVYKQIGAAILGGRWDLVVERLTDLEFYGLAFARSEPFIIQSILYYAVSGGWDYSGPFLENIFNIIIPLISLVSVRTYGVSDHLSQMFGNVGYGIASNLWAEAYVIGRIPMVMIFAIAYAVTPFLLNVVVQKSSAPHLRALIFLVGITLLFFAHRSGIEYTLVTARRFVLYFLIIFVPYAIMESSSRR